MYLCTNICKYTKGPESSLTIYLWKEWEECKKFPPNSWVGGIALNAKFRGGTLRKWLGQECSDLMNGLINWQTDNLKVSQRGRRNQIRASWRKFVTGGMPFKGLPCCWFFAFSASWLPCSEQPLLLPAPPTHMILWFPSGSKPHSQMTIETVSQNKASSLGFY